MIVSPAPATLIASAGACALALTLAVVCASLPRRLRRLERHAMAAKRYRVSVSSTRRAERLKASGIADAYWQQIRNANAPVLVTNPDGTIVAASKAVADLFGYADADTLERVSVTALYCNPADRSQYLSAKLIEHGHIRSSEFRMRHRNGSELRILTSVRVLEPGDGSRYYEGVLTDITELRAAFEQRQHLEAQLHLARKLELVGQLASGIAHEINTPLQFIGDNLVFLKSAFDDLITRDPTLHAELAAAPASAPQELTDLGRLLTDASAAFSDSFEGIQRVSETVRAMKEFAHPGDLEIASTDLNQAIRTTLIVARNEYKHLADVQTDFGDLPAVDCRRAEINKVLLNLIVNAAHAIESGHKPGRGTILITTRSEGLHARIDIADSGCGIPPAVLPRIFDPFFTTKAVGKGSGQGLAIAKSIIESHGGALTVSSTAGEGATFTIMLPAGLESSSTGPRTVDDPPDVEALIG